MLPVSCYLQLLPLGRTKQPKVYIYIYTRNTTAPTPTLRSCIRSSPKGMPFLMSKIWKGRIPKILTSFFCHFMDQFQTPPRNNSRVHVHLTHKSWQIKQHQPTSSTSRGSLPEHNSQVRWAFYSSGGHPCNVAGFIWGQWKLGKHGSETIPNGT